jgi:hypothetical protein
LLKSRRSRNNVALLLVLAISGCATGRDATYTEAERSPFIATLLAIFPGFFVHGMGNRYSGKGTKADELLEEEGLGVGCMVLGAGIGGLAYFEHLETEKSKNETELVLNRIGEVTSWIACGGVLGFGLVLFFDSWIKDMATAGDAAEYRNRELRRQFDLTPTIHSDESIADETTAGSPSAPHNADVRR